MATFGLICVAFILSLIITPAGTLGIIAHAWLGIICGIVFLYAMGVPFLKERDWLIMRHKVLAPVWGMCSFSLSSMAGCTINAIWFSGIDFDYRNYLIKPLYWLLLYGIVPSAFIGLSYICFGKRDLTSG